MRRICPSLLPLLLVTGPLGAASKEWMLQNPSGSQHVVQPDGTSLTLEGERCTFAAGNVDDNGEIVIAEDSKDSVHSAVMQQRDQLHLRITAGADRVGSGRARDLLIGPYDYGMAIEHPGVLEFWVGQFSIHNHPGYHPPAYGAWLWVGDEVDAGGLFASAHLDTVPDRSFSVIASDLFDHTSHGSLHFQVRNAVDAFRFQIGPFFGSRTRGEIGTSGSASYLGVFGDRVKGYLEADDAGAGALRLGSDQGDSLDLHIGGATPGLSLLASGSVRIGTGAASTALFPASDGSVDLGLATARWGIVRAARIDATGAVVPGLNLVSSAPQVEFDAALGDSHKLVLADTVTSSTLVDALPGQPLNFLLCQDSAGNHGFAWPPNMRGGMNVGKLPGRCSAQSFVFDGTVAWATSAGLADQ